MPETPLFERMTLIGVGLIGSSLAHACRRGGLVGEIVGCARSASTNAKVLELGICDRSTADPAEAVAGADLVVLCTPIGAYASVAAAMAPGLAPGAVVTDVGSVKQAAIRDIGAALPEGVHLVPGVGVRTVSYTHLTLPTIYSV